MVAEAEDLKAYAGKKAIDIGETVVVAVVAAAVAMAVLGGDLIHFVNALI